MGLLAFKGTIGNERDCLFLIGIFIRNINIEMIWCYLNGLLLYLNELLKLK